MKKKMTIGGAITLAIMLATVTFIMTMIYAQKAFDSRVYNIRERETMYSKLAEVDQLVRRDYYTDIDEDALSDGLVRGYLSGLGDANSRYMTAEEYKESLGASEGRTVGIGATFAQDVSGYIRISEVYEDSPAELMELVSGDLIVKVDELAVTSENYDAAVAAISGEAGTTVTLTVHHDNNERVVTVTRRKTEVPTVYYRTVGKDSMTGYIRLTDFTSATYNEFSGAVASLLSQNVTGFVFDVRGVSAEETTAIDEMLNVADRLVTGGDLLSATYHDGTTEVLKTASSTYLDSAMSVLVDSKTSGAAELFAQILRDLGNAKIVGTVTAGKCSMKQTSALSDGSAVTITTAIYNPPVSESFEGVGVKPDFEVKLSAELEQEMFTLTEASDPQFKKAIEAAGGSVQYDASAAETTDDEDTETDEDVETDTEEDTEE